MKKKIFKILITYDQLENIKNGIGSEFMNLEGAIIFMSIIFLYTV